MDPIIVGLAGGTGSGKTTCAVTIETQVVSDIAEELGVSLSCLVLATDHYYRRQDHVPPAERCFINYDEPGAIEDALLLAQLRALVTGLAVQRPTYDFTNHTRSYRTEAINPADVIVVEGLFPYCYPELRNAFDVRFFLETDLDTSLARRKRRDQEERGRDPTDIDRQFKTTVKPGHYQYVAPSRQYAHHAFEWNGDVTEQVALIQRNLEGLIRSRI
jgi:uridine kinase